MKKKSFLSLFTLAVVMGGVTLASCKPDTSSTDEPEPIGTDTSHPQTGPTDELTDSMLDEAATGYSSENLVTTDLTINDETTSLLNYVDVESSASEYHAVSYDMAEADPSKDTVASDTHYVPMDEGDTQLAGIATVGLSNTIEVDPVGYGYTWDETFNNFFATLSADDFTAGETQYHFTLNSDNIADVGASVITQATGVLGFELESLEVVTDGFHIVGFTASSAALEYPEVGEFKMTAEATINSVGADDVVTSLQTYTGTEDSDLEAAFASLANNNYQVTEDIMISFDGTAYQQVSSISYAVRDGMAVDLNAQTIGIFKDGYLYDLVGLSSGSTGPVTYYKSGYFFSAELPSFDISSIFFTKESDGVYNLDTESYPDVSVTLNEFDPFDFADCTALNVTIEEDSIIFTAQTSYQGYPAQYQITYSNIGQVEDFGVEVPDDVDYLRLDELYQVSSIATALGLPSAMPESEAATILHEIPTCWFFGTPKLYTFTNTDNTQFLCLASQFTISSESELSSYLMQLINVLLNQYMDCGYSVDTYNYIATKDVTSESGTYTITASFASANATETTIVAGMGLSIAAAD